MTLEELDRCAYVGEGPEGLNRAEHRYYLEMSHTYALLKLGQIDAEYGKRLKLQAREHYSAELADVRLSEHTAKMWAQIEATGSAYRKDKTIENADAFMSAVYGVYPN